MIHFSTCFMYWSLWCIVPSQTDVVIGRPSSIWLKNRPWHQKCPGSTSTYSTSNSTQIVLKIYTVSISFFLLLFLHEIWLGPITWKIVIIFQIQKHQIPISENPTHESRLLPINLLIYEPCQISYHDEIPTVRNLPNIANPNRSLSSYTLNFRHSNYLFSHDSYLPMSYRWIIWNLHTNRASVFFICVFVLSSAKQLWDLDKT